MFANYDQFCADDPGMSAALESFWEEQLRDGRLPASELERWQQRRELDRECSVPAELAMLRAAGFTEVQCLYQNQKFAVILARK